MTPDSDRARRLRFLERALDHYADPERALALAERMEWFVTGRAAPVLSLPAPASNEVEKPEVAEASTVKTGPDYSDPIPPPPVADEAAAIVESAREVQRASKSAVERAQKAAKPQTRRKADTQRRWTEEDDATVVRMTREGRTAAQIAAKIDRTAKAVELRRAFLGVKGPHGRPKKAEEGPDPVAEFIARNGVTRCPTAAVAPTEGARIPEADRRALQERQPVEYRGTIAAYFDGGRSRANARRGR